MKTLGSPFRRCIAKDGFALVRFFAKHSPSSSISASVVAKCRWPQLHHAHPGVSRIDPQRCSPLTLSLNKEDGGNFPMGSTPIFMESHEDYLARRIRDAQDRLLAAQEKVSRLRLELDGLKRQRNAQQMSRKHITELFLIA